MLTADYQEDTSENLFALKPSIFRAPFDHYSTADLQAYYQQRTGVTFFPVCEPGQVEPVFIKNVLQNRFSFNHEVHQFNGELVWTQNPSDDIEWLIMLHKGYYLVGLGKLFSETGDIKYVNKWIELTDSWIEQVDDPGFIATDVTGRRIQNWIYAYYYFVNKKSKHKIAPDFLLRFLTSIHEQVDYLINNLAVARNHRTLELHAVFLAAVVFGEFKKSKQWLGYAKTALADNAQADILSDGVHCELSTFYHHIVLKNLLAVKRLAASNKIIMPGRFDGAICRALRFSLFIHKPDGQIPSLSDGDVGSFYNLLKQGHEFYGREQLVYVFSQGEKGLPPQECGKAFPVSGYYVLRSAWPTEIEPFQDARYLVFDCGPLGAGNHGHLDLLNIEVAAYGRSLVVDPGRYTYEESGETNWRVLFRSTRYHNTVEVDGKNQVNYRHSEAKGKYHVQGPHAEAVLSCFISDNACHLLHGKARSHEYTALHERKIFFVSGEYWLISDILHDHQLHQYALRYHLSPEAQDQIAIEKLEDSIIIDSPNLLLIHPFSQQSQVSIEPGFVSTTYGNKSKAPIIKFQRSAKNTVFESVLFPYKQQRPELTLHSLNAEISAEQETTWAASAFSMTIQTPIKQVQDLFFISHDGTQKRWRYNNIDCIGQFCYIRLNSEGMIENYFTGPGSKIVIEGRLLTAQEGRS
jgi:uncharacterized heparinase superfamily protein